MASLPLSAARQLVVDRLAEGDAEGALNLARQIQQWFPQDRRTSMLIGRVLLAAGQVDAAQTELESAAKAWPDEREAWEALAACGSEAARTMLADLPPFAATNGERPAISAIGLGHLYSRQYLSTHCTAQLAPAWRIDPSRLDVGVSLAEAHWRLGEAEQAEDICRSLLSAAPECLKANLILAQQLWVANRRGEVEPFIGMARAVDPENTTASELYEWLAVQDSALVPLQRAEALLNLAEAPAAVVALEAEAPAAEPEREGFGAIEGVLGGPAHSEPIAEPAPFWELAAEQQPGEPSVLSGDSSMAVETPPEAQSEPVAASEPEPWSAPEQAAEPDLVAEPASEPDAARAQAGVPAEPAASEQAGATQEASMQPAALEQVELEPAHIESEPGPPETDAQPRVEPVLAGISEPMAADVEMDMAETGPEPAYAPVEIEAERLEALGLRWVEVTARGQLLDLPVPPAGFEHRILTWNESCRKLGQSLSLGELRAASVDSPRGAVQLLREGDSSIVALAPRGANLGLVRAKLRQGHHSV